MFLSSEVRREVNGLSDLIDYFALVADGVVLTSTGLYVAGWEFVGPDMDALSVEESWQIANRLASKFRVGRGWTVQCDLIRAEYQEYCRETARSGFVPDRAGASFSLPADGGGRSAALPLLLGSFL